MNFDFNLLEFVMTAVTVAIGFMIKHYINRSDENNEKLWNMINTHERRITTVETEHNMFKDKAFQGCHWHRREDDSHGAE